MKQRIGQVSLFVLLSQLSLAQAQVKRETLVLDAKCTASAPEKIVAPKVNELRIAGYNLENLFDASHDEGKQDFEYLPLKSPAKKGCEEISVNFREKCAENDWDEAAFGRKLNLMEASFKAQYASPTAYPDVVVLTEVENPAAVLQFGEKLGYVTKSGRSYPKQSTNYSNLYKKGVVTCQDIGKGVVMTNSPDERGIDVAIMYNSEKMELVSCEEYVLDLGKDFATRNIIAAKFRVNGETLVVLGNHWPSQLGPNSTGARNKAATLLKDLFAKYSKEAYVVASGDFNTLETEKPNPITDTLLGDGTVTDVMLKANKKDRGSYYYAPNVQWNHLDRLFVSDSLMAARSKVKVDVKSYLTHTFAALTRENKIWIFRDKTVVPEFEKEIGKKVSFFSTPEKAQDPRVPAFFKKDAALGLLEVVELCAPNRSYSYVDRVTGEKKQVGYSDHYPISVLLKFQK